MDTSSLAVIFAGVALALNLGQRVFGGGWNLQKNLASIDERFRDAVEECRKDLVDNQRSTDHRYGETVAALKEHVRQVEFHIRDKYVMKDDLMVMLQPHSEMMRSNFENINSRLGRIEAQLDSKKN